MVQQAPLKVDPETNRLISDGAHFLSMTKKDLVAEAVRAYLAQRRDELHSAMRESMAALDGSLASKVSLLTGLSRERLDELGGVVEE